MDRTYLNLLTGEHGELPTGIAFASVERTDGGWEVSFRIEKESDEPISSPFGAQFYDADGTAYEIHQWSHIFADAEKNEVIDHYFEGFSLKDYPYNEVWLSPLYSHKWTAENRIVIAVQEFQ